MCRMWSASKIYQIIVFKKRTPKTLNPFTRAKEKNEPAKRKNEPGIKVTLG